MLALGAVVIEMHGRSLGLHKMRDAYTHKANIAILAPPTWGDNLWDSLSFEASSEPQRTSTQP